MGWLVVVLIASVIVTGAASVTIAARLGRIHETLKEIQVVVDLTWRERHEGVGAGPECRHYF